MTRPRVTPRRAGAARTADEGSGSSDTVAQPVKSRPPASFDEHARTSEQPHEGAWQGRQHQSWQRQASGKKASKAESLIQTHARSRMGSGPGQHRREHQHKKIHRDASDPRRGEPLSTVAALGTVPEAAAARQEEQCPGGGLPVDSPCIASRANFSCRDFDASSPYLPIAYLGRGAIGRVFHCVERSTGECVAVKVVAKHLLRGRRRLQRQVLVEKEALVALSAGGRPVHPSVGYLRRTYQTSESLYFVLQYAGARSLRDVLTRLNCAGLRLSVGAARLWAAEAAAALGALRLRGILHRDIRPENIIVNDEGHLTLVDFDSAVHLAASSGQHRKRGALEQVQGSLGEILHASGRLLTPVLSPYAGTAAYSPPEMFVSLDLDAEAAVQQHCPAGFGSDCWSFGCLVHELLLGEPPFKGDSPAALARAICGAEELSLPQQLPASASDFITRLLNPREQERLGARNIKELLEHPFFEGIDCMTLHYQPLPIDVAQYAFAFQGSRQARRAAAAAAVAAAAALEAELTPSVGGHFSPLKLAASEAPEGCCPACDCSATCMCCGGEASDASPRSSAQACKCSSKPKRCVFSQEQKGGNGPSTPSTSPFTNSDAGIGGQDGALQQFEATEEPRASCRCAVTEAVLGWGPPLLLRPSSSSEYADFVADSADGAEGSKSPAGDEDCSRFLSGVSDSTPLAADGSANAGPGVPSVSEAGGGKELQQGYLAVQEEFPLHAARWLLKGEHLHYYGVLLRMRERRSFCERLFMRLWGRTHKANCQLQPQRCLALLTDTGRLLLLDPSGKTLRKTIRLATDGEIYTEGKDMLIYSSAVDGCYLLFASDNDSAASWARSLTLSIHVRRVGLQSARPVRSDAAACTPKGAGAEVTNSVSLEDQGSCGAAIHGFDHQGDSDRDLFATYSHFDKGPRQRSRGSSGGPHVEGPSMSTAATSTARGVHTDRMSDRLQKPNGSAVRRRQDPFRYRCSSTTEPIPMPGKSEVAYRPFSEGSHRYAMRLNAVYPAKGEVA
ncbi:uncharacterized protein LOC34617761 [Cyclospora cayetanensis]|uniref:non-specific serine/threonine protein kinase n=1 Tax=Cyclospora cayetanensis TaxID=88456 RepID=A0A6P6S1B9_9EIME|nr:uncharacterized protein LOC34617761 [Cyclospora cayetanensis]